MQAKLQKILVVDDEEANVQFLGRLLAHDGFDHILTASSGPTALDRVVEHDPDLILLDLHMPGMDGYEVLDVLRTTRAGRVFLPILVFTADVTRESRQRALELGASDFITKPGDAHEILLRVKNFLEVRDLHLQLSERNNNLESLVRARTIELEHSQEEILERLARAGERRDDATGEHTNRVSNMAARIGEKMGLPHRTVELLRLASRVHDLGKIGVPDSILLKPGKLTPQEYAEIQKHCETGATILADGHTPLIQMAERIARSHHERFDGNGYPDRLSGESIPVEASIVAVADVFDALTHVRPYKVAWPKDEAITEIVNQRGKQFDPQVVDAFLEVIAD